MGNRDLGVNHIRARRNHSIYGMGLGVIICDEVYPAFPGDVRNASAWPYPVQYEIAQGVDIPSLVFNEDKSGCLEPIIRAATKLERLGCKAISAECGFYSIFQRDVARAVDVPVLISSLIQVPFAQRVIGPDKVVGILVGDLPSLRDEHLTGAGIELGSNYVIDGASTPEKCPEFVKLWMVGQRPETPNADCDRAAADFVAVARDFRDRHPDMGALVMECTGFPPFARLVQQELDLPVFSYATLFDYAWSVVAHRDFHGHM